MWKKTLASLVLAGSLVACSDRAPTIVTVPAPAADHDNGHFVVNGTATLEVSPDCADISMTISADAGKPADATASAHQKEQDLIAALTRLGIETPDIKRSTLSLEPVYAPNPDGWAQLKVATYRAQITITASTRKFELVAPMMEAGATAGASAMSTEFRRADLTELKAKVREMAIANARAKATQTAKALGIDLGRISAVSESEGGTLWTSPYFARASAASADRAPEAVTLGGALQPLSLNVSITFELPRKA